MSVFKPVTTRTVTFGELPEVSIDHRGRYRTESNIRWTQIDSDNPYCDINEHIRGLLAIKLRMEADAKTNRVAEIVRGNTEAEARSKYEEIRKAHDDLRTSPIALKALALYNEYYEEVDADYASWDEVNSGAGCSDDVVRKYIEQAEREEAKEKEAAEKLAARRDQLVRNHGLALDAHCYNDLDVNGKYLVDRLRIALDEKRDAK